MLLHGPSGVGKSSLLAAGLAPRLMPEHDWLHLRRDPDLGLLGTLEAELGTSLEEWQARETERPLVVALDQVEEVFTRPRGNPEDELSDFAEALKAVFLTGEPPRGRLLMCFRKEWAPELDAAFGAIPNEAVFLRALDRRAIIEVVSGVRRHESTRRRYKTVVEPGLPAAVATDLLRDPDSPVAPLLQILLARLWQEAPMEDGHRIFGHDAYQRMVSEGLHLDAFLERQLTTLRGADAAAVDSGLALAVLATHITRRQTAGTMTEEALRSAYGPVEPLVESLVALHLLVAPTEDTTRLAHDTLAPEVRARFDDSDAPGQRARRILDARETGDPFDDVDLAVVEAGESGMRRWTPEERSLVIASRTARTRRKRVRQLVVASMFALTVSLIGVGIYSNKQKRDATEAGETNRFLERQAEARKQFDLGQRDVAVHGDVARALVAFDRAVEIAPDGHEQLPVYIGRQLWTAARAPVLSVRTDDTSLAHLSKERWATSARARSPVTGASHFITIPWGRTTGYRPTPSPVLDRRHRHLAGVHREHGLVVIDMHEERRVFALPLDRLEATGGDITAAKDPRLTLVEDGRALVVTASVGEERRLWSWRLDAANPGGPPRLRSLDVPGALRLTRAGGRPLTVVAEIDLLLGRDGPSSPRTTAPVILWPTDYDERLATTDPRNLLKRAYEANRARLAKLDQNDPWVAWSARAIPAFAWRIEDHDL